MDYRKIAIRVVYASIAIAVAAGVLTLFAPQSRDVIGRLIGTAITTGIAAALLLVAIKTIENPSTRPLGATLGALVCCFYISIVLAMWLDLLNQPVFRNMQENFGVSAAFIAACSPPILIGAACWTKPRVRIAGIVFFSIWIVFLLSWLSDTWVSGAMMNQNTEYFAVPLAIFSPIALFTLIGRTSSVRQLGIFLTAVGCVLIQIISFTEGGNLDRAPILLEIALLFGWSSAVLGLWNLVTFRDEKYAIIWLERLAVVLCGVSVGSLCILIWLEIHRLPIDDLLGRIGASSGILASTSVLAIIVTQLLRATIFIKSGGTELSVICPRCLKNLFIQHGKSTCPFCNLQFRVQIESPGCRKCGYDISSSIESNCCPECGEQIVISNN